MPSKTVEEQRAALVNASRVERGLDPLSLRAFDRKNATVLDEALYRALEAHDAFAREVSDKVELFLSAWDKATPPKGRFETLFSRFIIPKPKPDPLAQVAREMVLLDGVVRTDNQKAAIREGRAANTAADDFYDRLRTALAARGLKLVEVGDAD
jgi:hypothetical protein